MFSILGEIIFSESMQPLGTDRCANDQSVAIPSAYIRRSLMDLPHAPRRFGHEA